MRIAVWESRKREMIGESIASTPFILLVFGFSAKLAERRESPFSGPAFMAIELEPGALEGGMGVATIHPILKRNRHRC